MTGVTHSRALGEDEADLFRHEEQGRRQGKQLQRHRQLCDHRTIYERALLRETKPKKRKEYEAALHKIVHEMLKLELELGL